MEGDTTNGYIVIYQPGVYLAAFSGSWAITFSGDKWARIDWAVNQIVAPDQSMEVIEQSHGTFKVIDFAIVSTISGGGADTVTPVLQQDSGTNRDMNEAAFRVVRIADYT